MKLIPYLSKDKAYGKAIHTFYTQDQAGKKLLFAKVAYSGATVAQVTHHLLGFRLLRIHQICNTNLATVPFPNSLSTQTFPP